MGVKAMKASIMLGAAIAVMGVAQSAVAAAQTTAMRDYAIERQDLGNALRRFALESGVDVAFDPAAVRGRTSQGVRGRLGAEAALRALLSGSGLQLRRTASGGFAIARPVGRTAAVARQAHVPDVTASRASYLPSAAQNEAGNIQAAQTQAAADEAADPIVVTGSRVDRAGFEAPTPTTVIGQAELRQGGRSNVAAVLNDLPQFRATANPSSTAGNTASGSASADLRGIGSSRTLVLLNGRRFVGDGDLNSVPFPLVRRVEVVTGGASAAWGSEAVAGVVNIILDDSLRGLELSAQTGISSRGDGEEYRFGGTFGAGFAGGRGYVIAAADYLDYKGIFTKTARKSVGAAALIANPGYSPTNGQHAYLIAPDVGSSNASLGGLILSGVLAVVNFGPLDGSFSVREAFGEIVVPLVKDVPLLKLLELNGAARLSDYNTAGSLWSWKLGISNRISDDLRVRAVRSRDIRAPSISELYTAAGVTTSTINDPFTGQQAFVQTFSGGNADLDAEIADTLTIGAVFTPSWFSGFSLSVDYYDIDIKDAITVLGGQAIVTRCFDGNASLCPLVTRNAAGTITSIRSGFVNLVNFRAKGVDVEASYSLPLDRVATGWNGNLRFRVLANYVDALVNDDGITRVDSVGTVGASPGVPQWRGVAGVTYQSEVLTADLRARYVDGGTYYPLLDIQNNAVSSRTYFDLSLQARVWTNDRDVFTLFGTVANMFDRDPPIAPNSVHYDVVGRTFQIGVRANF